MNKKDPNNKIIIYSTITLAVILIFTWTLKKTYNISPKKNTKQAEETKNAQLKIGAKVVEMDGKKKIAVYIKPIKGATPTLSVIKIAADIKQKGINSDIKLERSKKIADNSWSFPILKVIDNESKAKDSITVEIVAFKLGKSPYIISSETEIAYIPIEAKYANSPVSISIDRENTEFYANDVMTKILYQ